MTSTVLPADGTVWRVTTTAGTRHLRLRPGAQLELPPLAEAAPVLAHELDAVVAAAPADLRGLWQLAEAQQPRWGWSVWRLGGGPEPLAWSLLIEPPDGSQQRYMWVRRSGGRMVPVCAVETAARAAAGTAS